MNSAPQATAVPRRHVWRWVLLGVGICLSPFLVLGAVALSYLTLDSDVRVLRQHMMAATDANWHTKVQMSIGRATLGAIGQGLRFVHNKDVGDARLALRAVKHASVGVYERTSSGAANWSQEQLFGETDRAMKKRGWVRLVGVADNKETVLVYIQKDLDEDEPIDICVAVVNSKEMVVASTTIDADALGELVAKHAGDDVKRKLHLARLDF